MVNNGIHSICEIYLFSQFYAEIGDLKLKKYNNFVFGKLEKSKVQKSLNVKKKSTPRQWRSQSLEGVRHDLGA